VKGPTRCLVLCSGAKLARNRDDYGKVLGFELRGTRPNVALRISDITRKMADVVPTLFTDLLELATYVYCADQAVTRGGDGAINLGAKWRRTFEFVVPVRHPDFWSQKAICDLLSNTLGFLSDDNYTFTFEALSAPPKLEEYLDLPASDPEASFQAEEVLLFSGGLDSLAGAIQEAVVDGKKIALVSHWSAPQVSSRQKLLVADLKKRVAGRQLFHIPVMVNKSSSLTHETTQRTRSFLFASLAATVAAMLGVPRVRMYENGIVSFNLPICEQVIGARATRTTHPRVLAGLSLLFSQLLGRTFEVEDPFIWKTRADIVELIRDADCRDMITYTASCSHVYTSTKLHTHCGECSQCIGRRFAVLAAGCADDDHKEKYAVDVLVGERKSTENKTMVESFVRTAREVEVMDDRAFFSWFGEVSHALPYLPGTMQEAALQVFNLHKRHAQQIGRVLDEAIRECPMAIRFGELPESCPVAIACRQASQQPEVIPAFTHSEDYRTVTLNGSEFVLTPNQAAVVQLLYEAHRNGTPALGQAYLLERTGSSGSRVRDVFKTGQAWGNLLGPGQRRGTIRLKLA